MDRSPHDHGRLKIPIPSEKSSSITRPEVPPIKTEFVLPPLREAIPEFVTHAPSTRPANVPRSLRKHASPSSAYANLPPPFGASQSSGPSSATSEVSASVTYPSPKRRRISYHSTISVPVTPRPTAASFSEIPEHHQPSHDSSTYSTKTSSYYTLDRRTSAVSASSSGPTDSYNGLYSTMRPSMPPPQTSVESDNSDRRYLPALFGQNSQPMFTSPFENDRRNHGLHSMSHASDRKPVLKPYMPESPQPKHQNTYSSPYLSAHTESRTTTIGPERTPFSGPGPIPQHQMESGEQFDQNRIGKRRRGNLPKPVTDLLRNWLHAHIGHPYPTEDQKHELVAQTGLTMNQISNWFINARRRRLPALASTNNRLERDSKQTHHTLPPHSSQ